MKPFRKFYVYVGRFKNMKTNCKIKLEQVLINNSIEMEVKLAEIEKAFVVNEMMKLVYESGSLEADTLSTMLEMYNKMIVLN